MRQLILSLLVILSCCLDNALAASTAGEITKAVQLMKANNYRQASEILMQFVTHTSDPTARVQAKYYLGYALYKLNLKQMAAFPFIEVVKSRDPQYKNKALDYLVAIADYLDERSLLNYSLNQLTTNDLTEVSSDIVKYRMAELKIDQGKIGEAIELLRASIGGKSNADNNVYLLAAAYLSNKQPEMAIPLFQQLINKYETRRPTDLAKGSAIMGLARAYYQNKKWDDAAYAYRQIPKDHVLYRQMQTELSWALFRAGKLRSAMSPLQTIHNPYYENFYEPESLILKSIILLFICKHDELDKTIATFENTYTPALNAITKWLETPKSTQDYFREIEMAQNTLAKIKKGLDSENTNSIPFFVMRTILDEPDFRLNFKYLDKIAVERKLLAKIYPKNSPIYAYGDKILQRRALTTKAIMTQILKKHLENKVAELSDFSNQLGFIRYETLNSKRTSIKKKIAQSNLDLGQEDISRTYYIQNGYRYWPFQGEYWRDEIGNYQYVGVNSCE